MRPFTFLLIGQAISIFGSVLTGFALAIWAYQQSDSSAMVYVGISLANSLPIFILGPIAGAAADRWNRKTIILTSQVAAISITGALTLLYYLNLLEVWHIIALVALNSVFTAFVLPTVAATVPLMVPKGLLTRANGSIALAFGIIELVCPLLSGLLYKQYGLMSIFAIDLITFSIGIVAVAITFIPQPPKNTEFGSHLAKESFVDSIIEGFRFLFRTPSLWQLIIFFCIVASCIRVIGLMVQPMILGFADEQEMGQAMTIAGAGVLFGSILLIPFRDVLRHMPIIFLSTCIIAVGSIFTPITTNLYLLAAGGFIIMACFPMLDTHMRTLFQRKVDPAILGRLIGVRNFVLGIIQTTAIVSCGWLADKTFNPAMKEGGELADILGDVYGVGAGRGIAVLISAMGIILVFVTAFYYSRSGLRKLDSKLKDIDVSLPKEEPVKNANSESTQKLQSHSPVSLELSNTEKKSFSVQQDHSLGPTSKLA